jgi:alkyl sulfatase BDS1-like metallo-beta-lactamase superfamily hydrolase
VTNTATVVGNIINPRSSFMYGAYIGENRINCGIGPQVNPGTPGFRLPSRTFSQSLDVLAAGVEMQLTYVPSETNDELAVFLPDARNGAAGEPAAAAGEGPGLLFSAEVIQGPSFPNLYSLRGTSYRNPATWFRSVDTLRRYDSWCMVPSHGPILCGRENVQRLLRSFRDAIQFTHDQAVRFINRGQTPPELALSVRLPGYLEDDVRRVRPARADMDPGDYLRTFYGSVPQAVREIYFGYLGWFEADPVGLSPVPQDLAAERLLSLAGGAAKLTGEAEAALKRGEAQWAAELATLVLRAPQAATLDDVKKRARETKAAAFVQLAEPELNPNWRNWYISAALQLRTNLPRRAITGGLVSPEIVGALPPAAWLNGWTLRLRAERTTTEEQTCGREFEGSPSGVCRTLGVWFSQAYPGAGPAGYALRIRRGVAAFQDGLTQAEVEQADLAIAVTQEAFEALVRADDSLTPGEFEQVLAKLFETGGVRILAGKGTAADVSAFFRDYFDPKMTTFPPLTVGS